jgi:hypothetical protein
MEDLHRVAAGHESAADYDPDDDGRVGAGDDDGITLSTDQLRDLLSELSDDDDARSRLLAGVALHQSNAILDGAGPNGPENTRWATEIGNFDGILIDANNDNRVEDYEERKERHEQIFGAINTVTGALPLGNVTGTITSELIDQAASRLGPDEQPVLEGNYDTAQGMRGRMEAAIIAGFYEHGAFGTREEVLEQISRIQVAGLDEKPFIDASGHFIPYDAMDADQRRTYDEWMRTDRVQNIVDETLVAAGNGIDSRAR